MFVFLQVRVTPNFSEMYVMYETTSKDPESNKEFDSFLDRHANNIRLEAEVMSLMGELPKLRFLRGKDRD